MISCTVCRHIHLLQDTECLAGANRVSGAIYQSRGFCPTVQTVSDTANYASTIVNLPSPLLTLRSLPNYA